MKCITNEQREAIVRNAMAQRDAYLAGWRNPYPWFFNGPTMTEETAGERLSEMLMQVAEFMGNYPRAEVDPRAWSRLLTYMPKDKLALSVRGDSAGAAADAFWKYWRENGETHRHGYYESTWGAINRALRTAGVTAHVYGLGSGPVLALDRVDPTACPECIGMGCEKCNGTGDAAGVKEGHRG